jgi:hypothetical protein
VFTIRLKTTLNLLGQLVVRLLEKIDLGATQGEDEFPSAHTCDLGAFALRNLPLAEPLDRRRETQILQKFLVCARVIRQ